MAAKETSEGCMRELCWGLSLRQFQSEITFVKAKYVRGSYTGNRTLL